MLYYSNSMNGLVAGYPWFLQMWARDSFLSMNGMLHAGMFEEAKNTLIEYLNRINDKGELPHLIEFDGRVLYDGIDTEPLFLIALEEYVKFTSDLRFLFSVKNKLNEIVNRILSIRDDDGFIVDKNKYTWMDTIDRTGKPIELESIFIRSLKSIAFILKQLEDPMYQDYLVEHKNMESKLINSFILNRVDRITLDGKKETIKRVNFIFPVYYNQVSYIELKDVFDELEFKYGLTTVSREESVYSHDKYHEGMSWVWINMMYSEILFRNSRFNHAYNILENNAMLMNKKSLMSFPECIDPETNEISGALMQAWSSAFAIETLDKGILGLDVDMMNKTIHLSPILREGMFIRRIKKLPGDQLEIVVDRNKNKYRFSVKSRNGEKYKVVFMPRF